MAADRSSVSIRAHSRADAALQVIAQPAYILFVNAGMQAVQTIKFGLFLDETQAVFAGVGVVEEDPDVDRLIAKKIGHVAENAVYEGALCWRSVRLPGASFSGLRFLGSGIFLFLLSGANAST